MEIETKFDQETWQAQWIRSGSLCDLTSYASAVLLFECIPNHSDHILAVFLRCVNKNALSVNYLEKILCHNDCKYMVFLRYGYECEAATQIYF